MSLFGPHWHLSGALLAGGDSRQTRGRELAQIIATPYLIYFIYILLYTDFFLSILLYTFFYICIYTYIYFSFFLYTFFCFIYIYIYYKKIDDTSPQLPIK